MNPPPPGQGPPLISMPTIAMMVALTLFLQAILIWTSARIIKTYKGVQEAAWGILFIGFGFFVIVITKGPFLWSISLTNFLCLSKEDLLISLILFS